MAKINTEDLLDTFKDMTLLELSAFVRQFEETFDVTAATVPSGVVSTATNVVDDGDEDARDEFDVVLESSGENKIQVIKVVREVVAGVGLKEAKELVEAAPKPVVEAATKEVAESVRAKLTAVGARVVLR